MTSSRLFACVLLFLCTFLTRSPYPAAAAPTRPSANPDVCQISSLRSEKLLAGFSDHPNAKNPVADILPVGVYKGISWEGFALGTSPLGTNPTNIFPVDAAAPYPITRFIVQDIFRIAPSFTITYDDSPSKLFTLHSLNFNCITIVTVDVPAAALFECTIIFTPFVGDVARTSFEATFTPVKGSEIPLVVTPKSPQTLVEFPAASFCGVTSVQITYKSGKTTGPVLGLGGGASVPRDLALMAMDNANYTLYYND